MPEVERRHNRVLHLKVGRVSHGVRHQTVVSALRPVTAKPNPFGEGKETGMGEGGETKKMPFPSLATPPTRR